MRLVMTDSELGPKSSLDAEGKEKVSMDPQRSAALQCEYMAANALYAAHGSIALLSGVFLVGASVVFWGQLSTESSEFQPRLFGCTCLIALLSVWALLSHQSRQIYMYKLHRIRQIEALFDLHQHSRFSTVLGPSGETTRYQIFGPSGFALHSAFYIVSAGGTVFTEVLVSGNHPILWAVLSLLLISGTAIFVFRNERNLQRRLRYLETIPSD